ncbi:MAG: diguanylate cyclase [Thermodesulfovibrionales bacterium]|nr:diguanylate cyclase [Thermodesulfovibrionales bacterium]
MTAARARVLIIEDNKPQADAAQKYLKSLGYKIFWAPDGKSAIKALSTEVVDVVLLDLELPDMHGTKILQWIKHNDATRRVCVIIVTAKDSLGEKVMGLEAGAVDYLLKPYNDMELQARIRSCLKTQALQDELEKKNLRLMELVDEVKTLAVTDHLTGLYNRRHMNKVLNHEFQRVKRYKEDLSCLMVDVDHFKRINDTFGHAIGDMVLSGLAKTLKECFRTVDIIARWGGEEFVVLMPKTPLKEAADVADRLLKSVSKTKFEPIGEESITISIGLCNTPDTEIESAEMIVDFADEALLAAKRNGRNRLEIYSC